MINELLILFLICKSLYFIKNPKINFIEGGYFEKIFNSSSNSSPKLICSVYYFQQNKIPYNFLFVGIIET